MTALRRGSRGSRVVELQRAITAATDIPLDPDGIFGEATEQAVIVYQFGKGLDRDGIAGPATLRALGLEHAPSSAPPTQPTGAPLLASRPPGWLIGVDLSDAQGLVDGEALVRAGVEAVWIKVSDGLRDGQRHAAENARRCQGAGAEVGWYGVTEPYGVASIEGQVGNFLRQIERTKVTATLPPWNDFELGKGLTGIALLTSAAEWCERVQMATGARPMIYTYPGFMAGLVRLAGSPHALLQRLARFPLAIAHYGVGAPTVPPPWSEWAVWQAGGDPALPGQRERVWSHLPGQPRVAVDVDYFRGTIDDLIALARPKETSDG